MALIWKEQLSTGVGWQEKQHREMLDRFGKLMAALEYGRERADVDAVYDFVESYLARHFNSEESAMERSGYSGRKSHMAEHRKLAQEISMLRSELDSGARLSLVLKVQRRIVDWFVNHIGNMDKSLGAYLRSEDLKHQLVVNC